jgi:hypothetical protein
VLVILRVVSGRVPPGKLTGVIAEYRTDYLPIAAKAVGLDRFVVGASEQPDGSHGLAAMTLWATVDAALEAYDGDLAAPRTLDGRSHGEVLDRVDYYEIDDGGARRGSGEATWLRLTAGKVARGLDAEIQQELRKRLPDLPAEVVEAFVGRRVLGADVEIALVTTWSSVPDGMALDRPIWPWISDRYDTFRVEVLRIQLEGSGAG